MYKCDICGHEVAKEARFCPECGAELQLPKPTRTKRKKRTKATYNFKQGSSQPKSGVPGWMKVLGVFVVLIVASFFFFNDTSEPYGNKDYSVYSDNVEHTDDSDDAANVGDVEKVISDVTDLELERVKQEYIDAYTKYTKLVTTGGEGDVQEALNDYKEKYFKYTELIDDGGSSFPDEIDLSDLSGIDGIVDLPTKATQATEAFSETLIGHEKVSDREQDIKINGEISLHIPEGAFDDKNRDLKIYKAATNKIVGEVFDLKLSNAPILFQKPIEIEIPLKKGANPKNFVALDEIDEDIWMVVPSEYDAISHSIKFQTYHFSGKGYLDILQTKLSGVGVKDVRKITSFAVGSFGTAGGMLFVTGLSAVTAPVAGVVIIGGTILAVTGVVDPIADEITDGILKHAYTDLNTTFKLSDGISVTWVNDSSSTSHLGGEQIQVCVERKTDKILFAMSDKISSAQRKAAMTSLFPFAKYKLVSVPKSILNLTVELAVVRNYYQEKGYKVPPTTDIWIYKMNDSGRWNGTKLEMNVDNFEDESEKVDARRMTTLSHEYWHSVYQFNGYAPNYKWLDECLATSFEGQVSPNVQKWYSQNILPRYDHFYDMYSAEKVAESMRTGLVFSGTNGTDADQIKRGYQLWPWGKYLLANQGHQEIQGMLSKKVTAKRLSAYFENYCKGILLRDFAIDDLIDENLKFGDNQITYDAPSGWNALPPSKFVSKSLLVPGNSKHHISSGIFLKPIPLSLNVLKFKAKESPANAPLVIRRSEPDVREEYMIIPPNAKTDKYGRYAYDDVVNDNGIVVLPANFNQGKNKEFMLGIINAAVSESWSEYFGYGENPMYAYYLRKPKEVVLTEVASKMQLTWQVPDFDYGLSEDHILGGYNIYVTDGKSVRLLTSVGKGQKSVDLRHVQLAGYTKIGVASVDKIAKAENGKPLTSEINWIPIKTAGGSWVKVNVIYGYTMGDKDGSESTAEHSDWGSGYKYKIGMGSATTSNSNNGRNTVDVENASFSHSWSSIPEVLQPGKVINQSISVVNNGSSGKNAMSLYGKTSFNIYSGDISEEVRAGGSFYKDIGSWDNESSKHFKWTVPKPDYMTLADPKKNTMKISIGVSSSSGGETRGYCMIEYEYRP